MNDGEVVTFANEALVRLHLIKKGYERGMVPSPEEARAVRCLMADIKNTASWVEADAIFYTE